MTLTSALSECQMLSANIAARMNHIGENVVRIEADALRALADRIGGPMAEAFKRAVELMYDCAGRVVVTGMGKSGIIARKIAATLSSTGTPALFMHPVEAVHGDLGMVVRGDVVLALSASGETEEILQLLATKLWRGHSCPRNEPASHFPRRETFPRSLVLLMLRSTVRWRARRAVLAWRRPPPQQLCSRWEMRWR